MASDKERIEVARKLRELDYADLQESLICAYLDALGIEGYADWVGIAHRLADLIDPGCRQEVYCKVCGHVIPDGWGECPRCKSKVVRDGNR